MLQYLVSQPVYDLQIVFADRSRVTEKFVELCKNNGISLLLIDCDAQIETEKLRNIEFVVIYKTKVIVHQRLLEKCLFFNFHSGNLMTNKGPTPIVWTILLGEKTTVLSLHRIDAKIDEGILIAEYQQEITEKDTTVTIEKRLEQGFPYLFAQLEAFLDGRLPGRAVPQGNYRRRIVFADYALSQADDAEMVSRKVRSQAAYGGLHYTVNGKNFRLFLAGTQPEGSCGEKILVQGAWFLGVPE